ncbi:EGF [Musa troglodytarum]|uniref:EGF n=1 Tax=Musa troglodytarum TaxID=320322 RepID=A0A9E7H1I6_9LILI|nr:EGF [Musa troglodytarum]
MTALIFHKNYYLLHQYLYYTSQRTHTLLLPCFICDLKEPEGQGMGWVEAVLVLVVLQSVTTSLPHWADAGDLLSPLISTYSHVFKISDEICNNSVECGKGSCQVSTDDSLGFVCKCNPGWSQFHIGDYFRFLPCIIPNCSINYSCSNGTLAASPSPHPTNVSKLDRKYRRQRLPSSSSSSSRSALSSARTALLFSSLSILSESLLVFLLWSGHLCE